MADTPQKSYAMKGRLYLSQTGWLLLSVPNALMRGAFAAINEPGISLPPCPMGGQPNAHITVMRPEEIAKCGGPDKISERGKEFSYTLGPLRVVTPAGWAEISQCWFIEVQSPELEKFRKSYGLPALPNDGQFQFHISVAVRKKHIFRENAITKLPEGSFTVAAAVHVVSSEDARDPQSAPSESKTVRFKILPSQPGIPTGSTRTDATGAPYPGPSYSRGAGTLEPGDLPKDAGARRPTAGEQTKRASMPQFGSVTAASLYAAIGASVVLGCDVSPNTVVCGGRGFCGPSGGTGAGKCKSAVELPTLRQSLATESRRVNTEPTSAQIEAGNYRKGHVRMHGLDITIENPKGSTRSGVDANGKAWSTTFVHAYGYIRGTTDKDEDHMDIFVGDDPDVELVYVVDQVNPATGKFDEHKALIGLRSLAEAKQCYLDNYEPGWKGLGAITPLTMDQFKTWLAAGKQKRPIASQISFLKAASAPVLILRHANAVQLVAP